MGLLLVSGGFVNLDNNQTTFSFNFKLSGRSTDPGGYHSGCFPTEPPPPDFYKYTTMDYYTMTGTGATTNGLVIAGNSISANAFQLGSRGGSVYCTCLVLQHGWTLMQFKIQIISFVKMRMANF
ncbi:MAG: hypothetical protein IPJ43_19715 [Saprospiraceae bacterium]|nr:hypothetical protein [Saprospiraceae bacterium]